MSETAKPSTEPRPVADSPGDVDGLLRAFFQAQVPEPWPPSRVRFPTEAEALSSQESVPSDAGLPRRRAATLARSRWALAAGVLALVLGHAILMRTFPEAPFPASERGPAQDVGTGPGQPPKLLPDRPKERTSSPHPSSPLSTPDSSSR